VAADLERFFKEAWSRALTGVGAAEQEAEKVLGKVTGMSGEELRRQARDMGERLNAQRREIEKAIEEGVRKAADRLHMPTQDELEALKKRMDDLTARVEAMGGARPEEKPGPPEEKEP
jgi:polyhydroxyalkanoate synthesis regulator phasin